MRPDWLVRGGLWRLLAVDAVAFDLPPPGDPSWTGLEEHVRNVGWRTCRAMALIVLGMDLLGWSTDFLYFRGNPAMWHTITMMRAGAAPICVAMFAVFSLAPVSRRHPIAVSLPFTTALVAFTGYEVGTVGGLEKPFFDYLMFALVPTAIAPGPLLTRIGYVGSLIAAMSAGFFVPRPDHWAHPLAPTAVAFLLSMGVLIVLVGHLMYVGTCRNYFQAREIQRAAAELKELSDGLERQVQAKTVELRRLYEHLQLVREDERARLSRELHDELGQQLSAIGYVLAIARVRSERDPATLRAGLEEVTTLLQRASETTREIARELRPPLLEQFGFVSACEWMARNVTDRLQIKCIFDAHQDGTTCPEPIAVAVYRVLQEALTNVGRHAAASSVRVELDVKTDAVELAVTDDGRGLPAERGDGLGLVGMEQRMLGLGGTFSAENAASGGTVVRVRVPLGAQTAA